MSASPEADERRAARRQRVLKRGKIVAAASLDSSIDVTIRDMSETGAKLKLQAPMILPTFFDVVIVTDNLLYPSRLAWQRSELVGVSVTGPPKPVHLRRYL